jgi:hypothetical protein
VISVVLAGWPAFWLIVLGVVALATLPWLLQAAVISVLDIAAAALRHGVELLGTSEPATTPTATVPLPTATAPVCVDATCTVVQMPDGSVLDLRTGTPTAVTSGSSSADDSGPSMIVGVGFVLVIAAVAAGVVHLLGRRRVDRWHNDIVTSIGPGGRMAEPEPST